jgi:HK97 family phage major capsid protein
MSNLKDLREQRGQLIHDARALLDAAQAEKRSMSDEDSVKFDDLMSKSDKIAKQIEAEERVQELEREAAASVAEKAEERGEKPTEEAELRTIAFRKALVSGVQSLNADETRALAFDNDAAGGYLSPPEQFVNDLIKAVDDQVFIRQKATVYQLNGAHSLGVPSLENDPADAAWTAEIGSVSEDSTMSFGKRELMPHLLTKLVKVSMKLLRNSAMNPESIVMDRLAYKFGISMEKGFLTGTGASQPLGIFTASDNGIGTARDVSTGNTTTSIATDGLLEAKYSLKGQYQGMAEWLFHRDAVKQIAKLKDGDGQYIWRPGITDGTPDMLLSRPINMSEYAPNTFTTGLYVGMFGDFSKYWIADSMALQVQRLNELYAATSQVGFIGRMESDGMPVLAEAFARVKLA